MLEETSVADLLRYVNEMDEFQALRDFDFKLHIPGLNLGKALDILMNNKEIMDFLSGLKVIQTTTVGDVLDAITTALCASSSLAMRQSHRVGTSSWKSVFFTSALCLHRQSVSSSCAFTYRFSVLPHLPQMSLPFSASRFPNRSLLGSFARPLRRFFSPCTW